MEEVEIWGYEKSVEELIQELQRIMDVLRRLDTTNMPDRTRGFVDGLLMGLGHAVKPPLPPGVQLLDMIVAAYQRKYGCDPNYEARSVENIKKARADLEERKKLPDWEERLEKIEKYRHWPVVE